MLMYGTASPAPSEVKSTAPDVATHRRSGRRRRGGSGAPWMTAIPSRARRWCRWQMIGPLPTFPGTVVPGLWWCRAVPLGECGRVRVPAPSATWLPRMRLWNSSAYTTGANASSSPQTIRVGVVMRCSRLWSPRSGIGQQSFPVQPKRPHQRRLRLGRRLGILRHRQHELGRRAGRVLEQHGCQRRG